MQAQGVGLTWWLLLAMGGPFSTEEDKGKTSSFVKDARMTTNEYIFSLLPR